MRKKSPTNRESSSLLLTVSPSEFRKTSLRLRDLDEGTVTELERPDVVVGRHSEADLPIECPEISRRHCRIYLRDHQWHVIDLHSTNGVFVNDRKVSKATLKTGDVLRLGTRTWSLELPAKPAKNDLLKSIVDAIANAS